MTVFLKICATPDCDRTLPRSNRTGVCKGCYAQVHMADRRAKEKELPAPDEPKVTHHPHEAKLDELRHLLAFYRPNPMSVAKVAFGSSRLAVDGPCLMLNGRPVGFHELMRRTNLLLLGWGLPQLTANPAWSQNG